MKNIFSVAAIALILAGCTNSSVETTTSITPAPLKSEFTTGRFVPNSETALVINSPEKDKKILEQTLQPLGLQPQREAADNSIVLRLCDSLPCIASPEGYTITTDSHGITIEGATAAGLFYGAQSLLQTMEHDGSMPHGRIVDEPRFAYRGIMLDVSRHFFSKEHIKKQIDAMARYKMNRLHLHLTDAAGWRVEIKRYPRLTQLGAWREKPVWKDWWNGNRRYAEEGSENAHGGYYTQDDIREIVAYAAERHITIIPEIEMPAHSEEVLTAYTELSCTHEPYKQADFCVGNEKTFEFLQNVLDEIIALFPSEYIHIGGDEAGKVSWHHCPLCQKRIKDEGLHDVNGLQSYLIHRIEKYLNSKGRQIIGWDEILDGGLAPNATVMSWRGTEGGLKAVAAGHKAIMSPGTFCYLDQYQDAPQTQPEAIGGYLPLKKVYSYNPVPEELDAKSAKLIYGVQGNLWAEYIPTPEHAETMLYPRLLAIAEVGWSACENKNYDNFHKRALREVETLKRMGYSPFDLANEVGNRPEADTPVEHIARGKKVTYAEKATYYHGYSAGGDTALVDGKCGAWNNNDGAWQGFIGRRGIDATIDLGQKQEINSVAATFMQLCNPEIFMPCEVVISAADNDSIFTELIRMEHNIVRDDTLSFKKFEWTGKASARYIRYQARPGGFGGWLFTDEIIVK